MKQPVCFTNYSLPPLYGTLRSKRVTMEIRKALCVVEALKADEVGGVRPCVDLAPEHADAEIISSRVQHTIRPNTPVTARFFGLKSGGHPR